MRNPRILVVDNEEDTRKILSDRLRMHGYEILTASDGIEALEKVEEMLPELVILDIRLPKKDGMQVLSEINLKHAETLVIMITRYMTVKLAVEAIIERGAYDFIEKPLNLDLIEIKVAKALERQWFVRQNEYLCSELRGEYGEIIAGSQVMIDLLGTIDRVAPSDFDVLITGETGTGKELIAHALHRNSPRSSEPFIVADCSKIQPEFLESEIFGHEKGGFTGAIEKRIGKMELADGGTLFLDEIGDMAYELQAKFLRAIQEREFERLGGTGPIKVDIRFIAATNRNIKEAIAAEKFRQDLFYRLNVADIHVPPLREHKADISLLIEHFLQKHFAVLKKRGVRITDEARELLQNYHWPGNIRELENCIRKTVLLAGSLIIGPEHLPPEVRDSKLSGPDQEGIFVRLGSTEKEAEKLLFKMTYEALGGNIQEVATTLEICERTVYDRRKEHIESRI